MQWTPWEPDVSPCRLHTKVIFDNTSVTCKPLIAQKNSGLESLEGNWGSPPHWSPVWASPSFPPWQGTPNLLLSFLRAWEPPQASEKLPLLWYSEVECVLRQNLWFLPPGARQPESAPLYKWQPSPCGKTGHASPEPFLFQIDVWKRLRALVNTSQQHWSADTTRLRRGSFIRNPPQPSQQTQDSPPPTSDSHSSLSLGMLWWWGPFPQPSSTSSSPGAFFSFFPITQCVTETWTSTPSLDHTHIFTQCLPWACNYESSAVNNTGRSLLWMEFIVLEEVRM